MNFDHRYTPSDVGFSMPDQITRLSNELSKAYAVKLNAWLGECVEKFCPEAMAFVKAGHYPHATKALNKGGFHYRSLPDGVTEFCQGDAVLARAKFEMVFKTYRTP